MLSRLTGARTPDHHLDRARLLLLFAVCRGRRGCRRRDAYTTAARRRRGLVCPGPSRRSVGVVAVWRDVVFCCVAVWCSVWRSFGCSVVLWYCSQLLAALIRQFGELVDLVLWRGSVQSVWRCVHYGQITERRRLEVQTAPRCCGMLWRPYRSTACSSCSICRSSSRGPGSLGPASECAARALSLATYSKPPSNQIRA